MTCSTTEPRRLVEMDFAYYNFTFKKIVYRFIISPLQNALHFDINSKIQSNFGEEEQTKS